MNLTYPGSRVRDRKISIFKLELEYQAMIDYLYR